MKRLLACLAMLVAVSACHHRPPSGLDYAAGFSFANYDYVVIRKPDPHETSTALYGMDVDFANLMTQYDMRVIGDRKYGALPTNKQLRTLDVRLALVATEKHNVLSVSFDDAVSGKTVSSITTQAKGNLFSFEDRTRAFETASDAIIRALRQDKGLTITDEPVDRERSAGDPSSPVPRGRSDAFTTLPSDFRRLPGRSLVAGARRSPT